MVLKRLFDIFLSSIGIIVSAPLWPLFALAVKLEDHGSVFYAQERVGKSGKIFKALKFRSMIPDAEKHTGVVWASKNDPRVTRVGKILRATAKILRATAMDELPQVKMAGSARKGCGKMC